MDIRYQYRSGAKGKNFGWYICDKNDFLQMVRNKHWREDTMWCRAIADGVTYMWTKHTGWFIPKKPVITDKPFG